MHDGGQFAWPCSYQHDSCSITYLSAVLDWSRVCAVPLTRSADLCCLQASICTELIKRLLSYGPALTAASAAVAELDCLCGLAAAARELGYCRPQLVADSIVHIEGGVCSVGWGA